jgi:hypothetical protein
MMRRTPFKSKGLPPTKETHGEREQRLMDRAQRAMNSAVPRAANMDLPPTVPRPKTIQHRNPALLAMARNQPCTLRIEGVCNGDWSTTVAAHSNSQQHGKAGARKADDQYHVHACFACHCWLDSGKAPADVKRAAFDKAHAWMIEIWRDIDAGMQQATPKEKEAARWALALLEKP